MNRSAILPFPAALRALAGTLAPLANLSMQGTHGDVPGGPPSMFDSAGASGLTVEVPTSEGGIEVLHAHLDSSPEVAAMLIVDPAGVWAPELMDALAEATGSPVDRLRVHSRSGLQVRAVVDEMLLPAGTGPHRLVRCVHGGVRPGDRDELLAALLAHTQVCAVLVGPMPTLDAQALVEDVRRLAGQPGNAHVRWLFHLSADHRGLEHRIGRLDWPMAPRVLHGRPLARSVSSVWNGLYGAWIAA